MKKLHLTAACLLVALAGCSDTVNDLEPYIEYTSLNLVEDVANDGSFNGTISAEAVGVEFNDSLVEGEDYEFTGVPSGVTPVLTLVDENNASIGISGQVANHGRCDSEALGLTFFQSAFAGGDRPENANVLFGLSFLPPSSTVTNKTLGEEGAGGIDDDPPTTLTLNDAGFFAFAGELERGVNYSLTLSGDLEDLPGTLQETLTILPDLQTLEVTFDGFAPANDAADTFAFVINFLDTQFSEEGNTRSVFASNTFCLGQKPTIGITVEFVD
jgi:hypothetical protein